MNRAAMDFEKMNVGQIAAHVPNALPLLWRYQFDFQCRGRQNLRDLCRRNQIDLPRVTAELRQLLASAGPGDWIQISDEELVRHITDRYHLELRATVPELIRLAEKVERVHCDHPSCPHGLAHDLRALWDELDQHMTEEEKLLFPWITGRRAIAGSVARLKQMEADHAAEGAALAWIRARAKDFRWPPEACYSWRSLYQNLELLEKDLLEHIHVENNILFERVLQLREDSAAENLIARSGLPE